MVLRVFIAFLFTLLLEGEVQAYNSVDFRETQYVDLEALLAPEFLDGSVEMTYWARNLVIDFDDIRVIFENGGDRLRDADGRTRYLEHPVLVLGEDHFVPIEECAAVFGFSSDGEALVWKDRRLKLESISVLGDFPFRKIGKVEPIHRSVELTDSVSVYTMLPPNDPSMTLEPGEKLLARRLFRLDGEPWVLAAIDGPKNISVALPEETFNTVSNDRHTTNTYLYRLKERALELAELEQGFCHGPREKLSNTVALTSDLCWSIREYEREFYQQLPSLSNSTVYCTQFITGRWLEQHPLAMADCLALEEESNVDFTWALHSWDHPKSGIFMNDYAPESLRGDTLHQEKLLLEWGVVPEHFYRFPGLTHDRTRLKAAIDLDLLPVDCDSWVSAMHTHRPPHRFPATDGSILLVHGNGNEASGIRRFFGWESDHQDWEFGPIWEFVDAEVDQSELFIELEDE